MSTANLTPAQHAVLAYAIEHTRGRIEWFPESLRGGARAKVLAGLASKALIVQSDAGWAVAADGYRTMGRPIPRARKPRADDGADPKPRRRENSKQALVIQMLQRPEGATIQQICAATGWQPHSVRGAFAGALKKKLGLNLCSAKAESGERVYRTA